MISYMVYKPQSDMNIGMRRIWSARAADICTKGPSIPTDNPAEIADTKPKILATISFLDNRMGFTVPLSTAFISGRPTINGERGNQSSTTAKFTYLRQLLLGICSA
jgi:hypothetical protein